MEGVVRLPEPFNSFVKSLYLIVGWPRQTPCTVASQGYRLDFRVERRLSERLTQMGPIAPKLSVVFPGAEAELGHGTKGGRLGTKATARPFPERLLIFTKALALPTSQRSKGFANSPPTE